MVRDRLAEFRRKANINDGGGDNDNDMMTNTNMDGAVVTSTNGTVFIEMPQLNSELDDFFVQVADVKKMIDDLKSDVDKVKSLHSKILSTPIPDERKKSELDDLMSTIKTSSQVIRSKLKDMEKSNLKAEEEDAAAGAASVRIRKTQHSALLRNFIDVMNQYQFAQTEYRDRCKARIKRQLEITGSKFSEDDVEDMIEQGNWSVFTQGIIMETEQARQMLADVEARHNDILKLEKSLKELHDLFLEMALLVESQGEVVDRIETHVTGTQDYVEKAQEQLKQAEVLQTKARKKKIYIIIILAIIALVLFLIIYLSL
ncbi:Syntaxin-1A [Orchesella cincta]|uniref:Syntaxin-1A n=1 Tax=Orchesella cincta TaxID=48709 RepID=A0A1D2MGW0_ORCCI|nr:Syntaxin-1A [Orchesella cincta]